MPIILFHSCMTLSGLFTLQNLEEVEEKKICWKYTCICQKVDKDQNK